MKDLKVEKLKIRLNALSKRKQKNEPSFWAKRRIPATIVKVKNTILLLFNFLLLVGYSHAQIKINVNWTDSQKAKAQQIKDWRKLNKQKIKQLKEQRKEIISKAEDLGSQLGADEYLAPYYQAKKHKDTYLPLADSLRSFSKKDLKDSAEMEQAKKQLSMPGIAPNELKSTQERARSYADQYESYDGQLKQNKQLKDSLAGTMEMMAKKHVKNPAYSDNLIKGYEDKLNAQKGQADKIGGQASQLGNMENVDKRQQMMNKAKQLGSNHFVGKTAKVEAAQQKLSKLKKKYSYVPNSNDLSTAKKANSLEGEPLKKRLTIGGTLQIHPGRPVGIDFNPQLGYRMNKKWTIGLGGTYRSSFGSGERFISNDENKAYGGRPYTNYMFFRSFFGHGEFELLRTNIPDTDTDELLTHWSKGLMVGIGKNYSFTKKVEGSVMMLYNFLDENPGPYERSWVIRFGFNWKR